MFNPDMEIYKDSVIPIYYGMEKVHTYIYGRHVTVQKDQKPLGMIQHKTIHAAPPKLPRLLLHLQKYDGTIQYRAGKEIILTTYLSRFPS